jgi:DNA integrity scanning protein DisA with diadenylate cyclase activity
MGQEISPVSFPENTAFYNALMEYLESHDMIDLYSILKNGQCKFSLYGYRESTKKFPIIIDFYIPSSQIPEFFHEEFRLRYACGNVIDKSLNLDVKRTRLLALIQHSDSQKKIEIPIEKCNEIIEGTDIDLEVFISTFKIASEIANEGREGKSIGTGFVIGDLENVLKNSKQRFMNPFEGHPPEERSIKLSGIKETIKEFAQLDGVFIIAGNGLIDSAGRMIITGLGNVKPIFGFGMRHNSVLALTKETNTIGIVVSQSGGKIRIFKMGKLFWAS